MPALQCPNGKWRWGENGPCTFSSKEEAERVGHYLDEKKKAEARIAELEAEIKALKTKMK